MIVLKVNKIVTHPMKKWTLTRTMAFYPETMKMNKWGKETAGGRKRQWQNEEDEGVMPRAPNHLRLFLESKGMT